MKLTLLLGAALALGQTQSPSAPRPQLLPPSGSIVVPRTSVVSAGAVPAGSVVQDNSVVLVAGNGGACGDACASNCCTSAHPLRGLFGKRGNDCGGCQTDCCNVQWLKPWGCDIALECPEKKAECCDPCGGRGGFLGKLLWCPEEPEEEKNGNGNGNGNGEKKNGNGKNGKDEKNGAEEKKNGNGEEAKEEEEEEEDELNPLMQAIKCRFPTLFERLECSGTKIYGWTQFGFTGNFDSPRDRLNFGPNFNNRSNDFTWNQMPYIVIEKTLDLDKKKDCFHIGYRIDTTFGHDAPQWENFGFGFLENFTGSRNMNPRTHEVGLSVPQFYVDAHLPVLTDRGIDLRIGRFFTLLGSELSPAPSTQFYSRNYEYAYAIPFTNFGAMATVHVGDTLDIQNAFIRGWEHTFSDANDAWGYMGGIVWNSCDKNNTVALALITSPERLDNNNDWRTVITAYYTRKFGRCNEWAWTFGGNLGWEEDGAAFQGAGAQTAEWYGLNNYLFYTVNKKLTFGARAEWFRDDDGVRSTYFNDQALDATRPGYAGNFYEVTFGASYKAFQNLRIRPEVRFDWFDGPDGTGASFNDRTDRFQTTLGFDVIWEF